MLVCMARQRVNSKRISKPGQRTCLSIEQFIEIMNEIMKYIFQHSTFHQPMEQPDSMIFDSNGEGTSFSSRRKLVPAKIDERGWFVNFSFKLAAWIFFFRNYDFSKILSEKKKQMVPQMVPLWLDILITTCTPLYSYGPENRCSAGRP